MDKYLILVQQKALEAFWTAVSESLPLIESGDLDPMTHNDFDASAEAVIEAWIKQNI